MLKKKIENKYILIVTLIFTIVSLAHCLFYVKSTINMEPFTYDGQNYIACAKRLLETGQFSFWGKGPDAYVSPVYPMFLALCMLIFGKGMTGIIAIRFIQSFMLAFGVGLSCLVVNKLTNNKFALYCTGVFLACNGTFSFYSVLMLTETVCFFFTMLFINSFIDLIHRASNRRAYLTGLYYALAVLTRPPIAILIPLFIIAMFKHTNLKQKLLMLGGFATLVAPWTLRNVISLKKLVFFSTQTNAFFYGFCQDPLKYNLQDPGTITGNLKLIGRFFKEDPIGELSYMTINKFKQIFLGYDEIAYSRIDHNFLDYWFRVPFVRLGSLGAIFGLFSKKYRGVSIFCIVFLIATFTVIPVVRYGFPFYPFLGMFTGLTISALYKYFVGMKK